MTFGLGVGDIEAHVTGMLEGAGAWLEGTAPWLLVAVGLIAVALLVHKSIGFLKLGYSILFYTYFQGMLLYI